MKILEDYYNRPVRLTDERQKHLEENHPELFGQIDKIVNTLKNPDIIVRSLTDISVDLFYRHYEITPVTTKYLCVAVKTLKGDHFILTTYFTDTVKKGELLWKKK